MEIVADISCVCHLPARKRSRAAVFKFSRAFCVWLRLALSGCVSGEKRRELLRLTACGCVCLRVYVPENMPKVYGSLSTAHSFPTFSFNSSKKFVTTLIRVGIEPASRRTMTNDWSSGATSK